MRVIEDVVAFRPQFCFEAFANLNSLRESHVKIDECRPVEVVPARATGRHKERPTISVGPSRESCWIAEKDFIAARARIGICPGGKGIANQIGSAANSGSLHIGVGEDVERMTSLKGGDARKFNSFKDFSGHALVQKALALADWSFPDVANDSDMTNVVVGIAALLADIPRVSRESAIALRGVQGIVGVVNAMGESVRAL